MHVKRRIERIKSVAFTKVMQLIENCFIFSLLIFHMAHTSYEIIHNNFIKLLYCSYYIVIESRLVFAGIRKKHNDRIGKSYLIIHYDTVLCYTEP